MIKSYEEISNRLNHLVNQTLGTEYLVNPFFRISKTTPEQISKYKILTRNHSLYFHIIISISMLLTNIIKSLVYIICSFFTLYQYFVFSKPNRKFDVIFLSHAIGANIKTEPGDQFFGLMPNYLSSEKYNVAIFYTNHYKWGYVRRSRTLQIKNGANGVFLCPKFLLPQENLDFLINSFKYVIRCIKIATKNFKTSPDQAKLLITVIPYFFSRATYNNFLLKKRCEAIHFKSKPKFFIQTLEGHSYEQLLFESLNRLEPKCKTIFYQHSPLVPGHLGLINFLQGLKLEVQVLVTGSIYKEFLERFTISSNVTVLGSQKVKSAPIRLLRNFENTLLFAPEGTVQATLQFIHLIKKMIQSDQERKYILRLHPNLQSNSIIRFHLYRLKQYDNFILSKSPLTADLEISTFVFYRSSAVGIEALPYKNHLVFYGNKEDSPINPMLIGFINQKASNVKEALIVLNSTFDEVNTQKRAIIYNSFFAKIDYSKLLNAVNNY